MAYGDIARTYSVVKRALLISALSHLDQHAHALRTHALLLLPRTMDGPATYPARHRAPAPRTAHCLHHRPSPPPPSQHILLLPLALQRARAGISLMKSTMQLAGAALLPTTMVTAATGFCVLVPAFLCYQYKFTHPTPHPRDIPSSGGHGTEQSLEQRLGGTHPPTHTPTTHQSCKHSMD